MTFLTKKTIMETITKSTNFICQTIMKARYYKDSSILYAKNRKNQSFGWSSILTGLELIKKGVRHIIGDVNTTKLFKDNWIPGTPSRPAYRLSGNDNILVNDLITTTRNTQSWNLESINRLLHEEDQILVKNIYLPQTKKVDRLVWNYDKSGEYTVKSEYWFAFNNSTPDSSNLTIPHGDHLLKAKIWKSDIMPKLKYFLWRILSKALTTITRLNTRVYILTTHVIDVG